MMEFVVYGFGSLMFIAIALIISWKAGYCRGFEEGVAEGRKIPPKKDGPKASPSDGPSTAGDIRDLETDEQLQQAGYCTQDLTEEEFVFSLAGTFNFAEEDDEIVCLSCRTIYLPYAVFGSPKTKEDGFVGYFCSSCGWGFTSTYDPSSRTATNKPMTALAFLRTGPAPVVNLKLVTSSQDHQTSPDTF